jgi:hypothetical protein
VKIAFLQLDVAPGRFRSLTVQEVEHFHKVLSAKPAPPKAIPRPKPEAAPKPERAKFPPKSVSKFPPKRKPSGPSRFPPKKRTDGKHS